MSATVKVNGSQVFTYSPMGPECVKEQPVLYSYLRDEQGNPYGCVAALSPTQIGWSLCHSKTATKRAETFNKTMARYIACQRAVNGTKVQPYPERMEEVQNAIARMKERATKYFR